MCWSLHCFFKHLSKERLHPVFISSEEKWLGRYLHCLSHLSQDYLVLQNKYSLNWTRKNLPFFFQKIKVQLAFFKTLPEFVLLLFKSIARRCVLDVLLKFCCFLIILTFYHYKEHSRIPWTERIMGASISFECICIMWFFNTFIYSFLPTVEQKEREKHFKKLKKHYEMPAWQGGLGDKSNWNWFALKNKTRSESCITPFKYTSNFDLKFSSRSFM